MGVHARQLALKPRVQQLRQHRRPLRRRLEQAGRPALAHHDARAARLGASVLIRETWYKWCRSVTLDRSCLFGGRVAILATSTLMLLSTSFAERPERTRAVAFYGSVDGIDVTTGLVIGGTGSVSLKDHFHADCQHFKAERDRLPGYAKILKILRREVVPGMVRGCTQLPRLGDEVGDYLRIVAEAE